MYFHGAKKNVVVDGRGYRWRVTIVAENGWWAKNVSESQSQGQKSESQSQSLRQSCYTVKIAVFSKIDFTELPLLDPLLNLKGSGPVAMTNYLWNLFLNNMIIPSFQDKWLTFFFGMSQDKWAISFFWYSLSHFFLSTLLIIHFTNKTPLP